MNESNQNFDELKWLLKLKRHEIPPPGYFNQFSGEVMSRIRAGEEGGASTIADQFSSQAPWLMSLLRIFETRPGVIGGLATSLCLVLLIGVVMADRPDTEPTGTVAAAEPAPAPAPEVAAVVPSVAQAPDNSGIAVSTNPVISLQPVATLFSQQQNPLFQAASFAPAGR
jgi:hypothetical protein